MDTGAQCAVMDGIELLLRLCVISLDIRNLLMPILDKVLCLVVEQVPYWWVFNVTDKLIVYVPVYLIILLVVAVIILRMSV